MFVSRSMEIDPRGTHALAWAAGALDAAGDIKIVRQKDGNYRARVRLTTNGNVAARMTQILGAGCTRVYPSRKVRWELPAASQQAVLKRLLPLLVAKGEAVGAILQFRIVAQHKLQTRNDTQLAGYKDRLAEQTNG